MAMKPGGGKRPRAATQYLPQPGGAQRFAAGRRNMLEYLATQDQVPGAGQYCVIGVAFDDWQVNAGERSNTALRLALTAVSIS